MAENRLGIGNIALPMGIDPNLAISLEELTRKADDNINYLLRPSVVSVSANITLSDLNSKVLVDAASGDVDVTLPDASSMAGKELVIKKTDASANAVNIIGVIDGVTNPSITTQYQLYNIVSNGTAWSRVTLGVDGADGANGVDGADGADGIFSEIASQAEAEAGADNTKGMTPLRTAQAIAASTINLASMVTGTLPILNGGTGQTTAQAAIDALTAVSTATNEHVLTKDTATGNAKFKALPSTGVTYITGTDTTTLLYSSDTERSYTAGTRGVYVLLKAIPIPNYSGTVYVRYDQNDNGGGDVYYARLYKNGVAVGTQYNSAGGGWVTRSESGVAISAGDRLELWVNINSGSGTDIAYVRNFRIYYTTSYGSSVDQSL